MHIFHKHGHVVGGGLLIAGTTIGVGMLALPIATGPGGFLPSIFIYIACWAFMLCTGLLLLEVCTWMPEDANLITMATRLLGKPGQVGCWLLYLLLFELVMVSHIAGGGNITHQILSGKLGIIPSMVFYTILFSPIVYLGTKTVDRLNLIMFSGVLISYFLFVFVAAKYVNLEYLDYKNWGKAFLAIPILFTAFTYQVIVPTLVTYMKRDFKKVRTAILFGTSIPITVYIIWQILILGIVPVEGPNGLNAAAAAGENAVSPLKYFIQNESVIGIGKAFGFFTLTASYIALALAFVDFLADGLKVKKSGGGKLILCLAVFVPPLLISVANPGIFLSTLGFAGGISCAILFGLYPPLMVWVGRYKKGYTTGQQIPGGKIFLSILIFFIVIELGLELIPHFFR